MGYVRAEQILPEEIIHLIQQYVDGECIYIPRRLNERTEWGTKTGIRKDLETRNQDIYSDYEKGYSIEQLAYKYYLSEKSIQRIIYQMKRILLTDEPIPQ